jgi:adenylate cyclase
MNEQRSPIGLLHKLRKRKIVQWAVAYLAGAWLVLEVVGLLADHLDWPAPVFRVVLGCLGVGLVAALVVAWYHGEQGRQRVTGPELIMMAGIFVLAGGVVALAGRGASGPDGVARDSTPPTPAAPSATPATVEEGSIAVLPFVNMSPDPDQEFFSDGLTEELLNVLAQVPGLKVAARTSSFYFKDRNVPVDSVARLLRVAHVLEGSVRKANDRIRITAQLIEAESGYHVWSETYDRTLDDIFAVQDEIARTVLAALRVRLPGQTGEPLISRPTASTEAYNQYLLGRYHWNRRERANVERAVEYFEEAIDLDPAFASAHAGLADAYSILGYYQFMAPDEAFGKAAEAARRALELGPDNPDAHVAHAYVELHHGWNWPEAEAGFRRALELNPGSADAHRFFALYHAAVGRLDRSVTAAATAVELDPISPITHRGLGRHHYFRGEYDQALARQDSALEIESDFFPALFLAGQIHIVREEYEAALGALGRAESVDPESPIVGALIAHVLGRSGREDEARRRITALESDEGYVDGSAFWVAVAWLGLGDLDRASAWLERAHEERSTQMPYIAVEPMLRPLHGDPRFTGLLERMGLPGAG